jgi:hypothetical protein
VFGIPQSAQQAACGETFQELCGCQTMTNFQTNGIKSNQTFDKATHCTVEVCKKEREKI